MFPRKSLAPNNRAGMSLEDLMGYQFANINYPKNSEKATIKTWSGPGKGQQGESVTGGTYRATVIRRQHNTRAN